MIKTSNPNEYAFGIWGGIHFMSLTNNKAAVIGLENYQFKDKIISSIVEINKNFLIASNYNDNIIVIIDREKR